MKTPLTIIMMFLLPVVMSAQTVADSQRQAQTKYPSLALQGSRLHEKAVELYNDAKQNDPKLLSDPNWPMILADRAADSINEAQVAGGTKAQQTVKMQPEEERLRVYIAKRTELEQLKRGLKNKGGKEANAINQQLDKMAKDELDRLVQLKAQHKVELPNDANKIYARDQGGADLLPTWFDEHAKELAAMFPSIQDAEVRKKNFRYLTSSKNSGAGGLGLLWDACWVVTREWDAAVYRKRGDLAKAIEQEELLKHGMERYFQSEAGVMGDNAGRGLSQADHDAEIKAYCLIRSLLESGLSPLVAVYEANTDAKNKLAEEMEAARRHAVAEANAASRKASMEKEKAAAARRNAWQDASLKNTEIISVSVIQVSKNGLLVNDVSTDKTLLLTGNLPKNIVDGDNFMVQAEYDGTAQYSSVLGSTKTVRKYNVLRNNTK